MRYPPLIFEVLLWHCIVVSIVAIDNVMDEVSPSRLILSGLDLLQGRNGRGVHIVDENFLGFTKDGGNRDVSLM